MPTKPPSAHPHRKWTPATRAQAEARRLRSTARWQRYAALQLRRYPVCTHPACNGATPATQVHHVLPVVARPDLLCDPDNTPTVCEPCHALLSAMERHGQADEARLLFTDWREKWERILRPQPEGGDI